jgi:2-polyprenyl-6-methoxyphenol hydroxylase-like FAD-dependent oxidoreductase
MEARGSCRVNFGSELRWFHHGCWKVHYDSGLVIHMQSRPFLESIIRERLAALGNVAFRYRTAAASLEVERGRATAVRVREAGTEGPTEPLAADLVLNASGRGSQLVRWLEAHGYPAPREESLGVDVVYSSRIYRRPSAARSWKALLVYHNPPADRRVGLIFPLEGDRWVVTLGGYLGDHAPTEETGWLDFARNLSRPDLHEAIRDAEPLSEVQTLRFPQARWTHFEAASRFPAGLLPLGDTVCSFDPVFGQGMSVSFREAQILGSYLDRDPAVTNSRPFRRALAKLVSVPWLLTASEDLRYAPLAGRRPFWLPALQKYTGQVFRLAASRPADYDRLLRVLHLLNGPELLFHPKTLAGVLGRSLRRG